MNTDYFRLKIAECKKEAAEAKTAKEQSDWMDLASTFMALLEQETKQGQSSKPDVPIRKRGLDRERS